MQEAEDKRQEQLRLPQARTRHLMVADRAARERPTTSDYRLSLAAKMGANLTVDVTRDTARGAMVEPGMTEGCEVGLEMSGNPTAFRDMLATMNAGGRIGLLGIPPKDTAIDWNMVVFKGLIIKGIYGREMFETWYKMRSMLQSGLDMGPVITHHFPIDEFQAGFDVMRSGKPGKVVLDWA